MSYDLVIFDCDGTLVNTEHINAEAILSLIKDFGINRYDVNYCLTHFSGYKFSYIMEQISSDTDIIFPDNISTLYIKKINSLSDDKIQKIDKANDMVKLAKSVAKICVASNGERSNVIKSLKHGGLYDLFGGDNIFTSAMVDNPKPAADLFVLAAKMIGANPNKTLVIEDSIAGVRAAKSANMECWVFCATNPNSENHTKTLLKTGADNIFMSMEDMISKFSNKTITHSK